MALTTIDDRGLKTPIDLLDNEKIRFGTGNDLEIYHDSNNSVVQNSTGQLYIKSPGGINIDSLSEQYIHCTENADVQLYYDDSKKLETTSSGVTVYTDLVTTGNCSPSADGGGNLGSADYSWYNLFVNNDIHVADNGVIQLGDGNDLQIYHNGSHSYIDENGTGILAIRSNGTEVAIASVSGESMGRFINDGAVELYYNNVKSCQTDANGLIVYGPEGGDALIKLYADEGDDDADQYKISTSSLGGFFLENQAGGSWETNLKAVGGGAVELYHNNVKKFETDTNGVTITGQCNVTSNIALPDHSSGYVGKMVFGGGDDLQIYHDGTDNYINAIAGNLYLRGPADASKWIILQAHSGENSVVAKPDAAVELYYDGTKMVETQQYGVTMSENLYMLDTKFIYVGSGADLVLHHNTDVNYIDSRGRTTIVRNLNTDGNATESMAKFIPNDAVELYFDNSKKFETSSSGVIVIGGNGSGRILPGTDGEGYIGDSSNKWNAVYATNGSIQTSDRNEKNTIIESDLGLNFINKLKPISYKWNKDDGKTHYGLIAQDVEEALSNEGKTDKDFAALNIPTEGSMGLNYSELISPLIKAIQELTEEVSTLKTKVAALEAA